jgi:hypothetical protein
MAVRHLGIDPSQIKGQMRGKAVRTGKGFDTFLTAMDAVGGTLGAAGVGGGTKASAVISAAFSGMSAGAGMMGGGMGAMGGMGGSSGVYASAGMPGLGVPGMEGVSGIPGSGSGDAVIPGTEGFTQWDMINTMNTNNLKLLELQALMQSNMQAWNTKSNILNADHRVKTTMIEKLSPR